MTSSRLSRIATRINLALDGVVVLVHAGALIVAPAMNFAANSTLRAFAAAAAIRTPMHWVLIHNGIHGLLLPGRAANECLARIVAIAFGAPFRACGSRTFATTGTSERLEIAKKSTIP